MKLKTAADLFSLSAGDTITKRNLFDLIQFSKVENSPYWAGPDSVIGNTPQQGINWVGPLTSVRAAIIKTRPGAYDDDGWSDAERTAYRYSFKARKDNISLRDKANGVLIRQPEYLYPVLLFTEKSEGWSFEGTFSVSEIQDRFVVLRRGSVDMVKSLLPEDGLRFPEGERKYVTHLMAERSRGVVRALKDAGAWVCDICGTDFHSRYGVKYIEAHHKVPMATYSEGYKVAVSDLALLCPNCHKAVHIYMKRESLGYADIRNRLRRVALPTPNHGAVEPH